MNLKNWKPYYMKKGKYLDGRNKILIAWYEKGLKKKTFTLPKPEELLRILRNGEIVPKKEENIKGD